MQNLNVKRIFAYLVDIIVISLISMLLSNITFLNPNYKKYEETYTEYEEYLTQIVSSDDIDKAMEDDIIHYTYQISYYSLSFIIIEAAVIILYFTLFPYYNNGQTIGKQLFKITLVKESGEKLKLKDYFLRSLLIPISSSIILYNNIYNILNIILLLFLKEKYYLVILSIVAFLSLIYSYIDVIMLLFTNKKISLHDRLCKTKVIDK